MMKTRLHLNIDAKNNFFPDNLKETEEDIAALKCFYNDYISGKTVIVVENYTPTWMLWRIEDLENSLLDFIIAGHK